MSSLEQLIIEQQSLLRMVIFITLLMLFLSLERYWPRRKVAAGSDKKRRLYNLGLLTINIIAVRILIPLALFQAAMFASSENIGLFNLLGLPLWINLVLSILLFDLLIYLQHVAFHKFAILWRIHRIHHTDLQFDVTTGVRFHPFEILLSMLYKLLAVVLFGPVAIAIILYEVLLNAFALFTHSNLGLPARLEVLIRRIVVTPDMHRVHHSVIKVETDSNYGNIFSFWDKLFLTYRSQPEQGHENMQIGLLEYRLPEQLKIAGLLVLPFKKE